MCARATLIQYRDSDTAHTAEALIDEALSLLPRVTGEGKPWYLQIHLLDPHMPYTPPEAYLDALEDLPPLDEDISFDTSWFSKSLEEEWFGFDADTQETILAYLDAYYREEGA